ncbi:MAG: ABC transporter ATP-binding protein [Actinomycetota bacterium]
MADVWRLISSQSRADQVGGAHIDRATARRAWGFARPYRRLIAGYIALVVLAALTGLLPPLLTGRIIDLVDGVGEVPDRGRLNLLGALLVGAAVATAAINLTARWLSSRVGEGLIFTLRSALFDHVQRMPVAFFTHSETGALVSRLNNDVIGAQRAVTGTLGTVVSNTVVGASTLVAMTILDWRLTLLSVLLLPMFIVPTRRAGGRIQHLTRESMELNASMNSLMTERFSVAGALLVKLFGRHGAEATEFTDRAGRVRDIGVRSTLFTQVISASLGLVGELGVAIVVVVGGHFVISGSVGVGTIVALSLLLTRLYGPLTNLTTARIDVMATLVSFERVFDVLDRPTEIDDTDDAKDLDEPRGDVELRDVDFTYPDGSGAVTTGEAIPSGRNEQVLHGISLRAPAGSMVALVGPSGAGKSTIASLVTRLYDVDDGAVLVDGADVRSLRQESLRSAIGVVPQDPHLFHDTVAANLRYARPLASNADLEAACRAARIHDVIAALPDGYDTVVGERGYRLSGGEKQRLALARLLLKDPRIVILDEATSHLDAENEALIGEALSEALSNRTSLVIAHRLSTVRAADQIVVIDDGRVVERGTHDELVALDGLYADLHRTLVGDEIAEV